MDDSEKFKDMCTRLKGDPRQHPHSRVTMCEFPGGLMSYDPVQSEINLKFSPKKTMVIHNVKSMTSENGDVEIITAMKNKFKISKEKFSGEVY